LVEAKLVYRVDAQPAACCHLDHTHCTDRIITNLLPLCATIDHCYGRSRHAASRRLNERRRRPCSAASLIVTGRQLATKPDVAETNCPASVDNRSPFSNRIMLASSEGFAASKLFTVSLSTFSCGLHPTKHRYSFNSVLSVKY